MWIEDQDDGLIIWLHEFLDDYAGQVAFARAGAGNDRQMGTHQVFHRETIGTASGSRVNNEPIMAEPGCAARLGLRMVESIVIGQEDLFADCGGIHGLMKVPVDCS